MAITVQLARPAATQYTPITPSMATGTIVEVDTADEESFFIPVRVTGQDPPSFTVASCTTTSSSTAVTTATANGFANVRVGDPVTGTGIAGGTTVSAKNVNNLSLTLSANATASGTVTLTFDPDAITAATVYAIKVTHQKQSPTSSARFTPLVTLYEYDGSLAGTTGTAGNATKTIALNPASDAAIDMDAFLANLRVPKT